MTTTDVLFLDELDGFIAQHKLRIEQQRIHTSELSADPTQQKHAQAQLAAMTAGLAKLQEFRRRLALSRCPMPRVGAETLSSTPTRPTATSRAEVTRALATECVYWPSLSTGVAYRRAAQTL